MEKEYVIQGDLTQHVVIRVRATSLDEAVKKAEMCNSGDAWEAQVIDFCPDLYRIFEWDGDEESVEVLDELSEAYL